MPRLHDGCYLGPTWGTAAGVPNVVCLAPGVVVLAPAAPQERQRVTYLLCHHLERGPRHVRRAWVLYERQVKLLLVWN